MLEAYYRLAEKAKAAGVGLGIEPVNRYESNFINTLGQAAEVVRKVGSDTMFVQMDTYHMNIEESDIAGAIEANKDVLGYAHIGESNRGCLGQRHVRLHDLFQGAGAGRLHRWLHLEVLLAGRGRQRHHRPAGPVARARGAMAWQPPVWRCRSCGRTWSRPGPQFNDVTCRVCHAKGRRSVSAQDETQMLRRPSA